MDCSEFKAELTVLQERRQHATMHVLTFKNALVGMGTIAASILVLVYALLEVSQVAHSSQGPAKPLPTAHAVQLGSLQAKPLVERFNGVIQATRTVDIASSVLARVEEVKVQVGDRVETGQAMVRLDSRELRASAAAAKAELARNQAILDELIAGARQQELAQAEAIVNELASALVLKQATFDRVLKASHVAAISATDLDSAMHELQATKARAASAEARLSQLREGARPEQVRAQEAAVASCAAQLMQLEARIEDTVLVAPFDGRIQSRFVDEGKIVAPGQSILTLVESSHLEVLIGLPADSATRLLSEQLNQVVVEVGRQRVNATLARVAPALDRTSGTRSAVFKISDQAAFAPGDAATVIIEHSVDQSACWLPTSSLISGNDKGWAVLVAQPSANQIEGYRLAAVGIELLDSHGEMCRVKTDLADGSLIVSQGTHRFAEGQMVDVRSATHAISTTGNATHVN
jgi:multidrug efflux pump subunit AcrA (membrane-fusion protein)